jgi:putative transposase
VARSSVTTALEVYSMSTPGQLNELTARCLPHTNSIAERWVASARHEALDWLLVVNERHLRCILKEYVEYYNRARPHRSLDLRPPTGDLPLGDRDSPVIVTTRMGGLLREYSRAAA